MVPVLPSTLDPQGVYKAGEVCKILGIGATTLWRYAKAGTIRAGHRPGGKQRLYSGRDIIKLHRIIY